jgi:AcrR family transcriptional regulator
VSPDRILAAAAHEFAARGFAGARVDRIARRARVNKAMLYYHFGSKQALYRVLLRRTFAGAAERLRTIAETDQPPAKQIDLVIAAIAGYVNEHAFFPAIMLREVADGGVHLDSETLAVLAQLPAIIGGIVTHGVACKALRPQHPLAAYFTMFAPIVLYLAGAPIRKELAQHQTGLTDLTPDVFVHQLQNSIRLAFTAPGATDCTS